MTDTITIIGLNEVMARLNKLPDNVKIAMRNAIKASTLHVQGKIAKYPPSTGANVPKEYQSGGWNTWYQRGWGSKWALSGGGWHGRASSEQLGQKWTITIKDNGFTGVVGNNVSYGPYVQDTERQAQALKRIGWKTTGDVAAEETDYVMGFIQSEITKALNK